MKKLQKIIILVFISVSAIAADVYEDIANSIRTGNASQLAAYFAANIDLTVIDKENVYSKAQAEFILKDFFAKNPPKTFTVLHKGSSPEGMQYTIGNLVTENGKTFRTSFYVKNSGGKYLLQELRIEIE
jgi:hypothetical protein